MYLSNYYFPLKSDYFPTTFETVTTLIAGSKTGHSILIFSTQTNLVFQEISLTGLVQLHQTSSFFKAMISPKGIDVEQLKTAYYLAFSIENTHIQQNYKRITKVEKKETPGH